LRRALIIGLLAQLPSALAGQCPNGSPPPCSAERAPPPFSVAVLGFRAIGNDSGDVFMGDGLAEELTSRLGRIERLSVTSRSIVRRLPNVDAMPLDRVGRALNSTFLVQGSLRRTSGRLRITAELMRASTGAVVWSEQYDRSDDDILLIQEIVATRITQAVAGHLLPAERSSLASSPTRNAEAYRAYLRGRSHFLSRLSVRRVDSGIREFQSAVALDTAFAEAWAWLSVMHSLAYWNYADRTQARADSALNAATRARSLAPSDGMTHIAFGEYWYRTRRDYGRSLQSYTAALASDPRDPLVHAAIATIARRQGDFDLAIRSWTRAVELDPMPAPEHLERAVTYRMMRRYDEAEQDLRRVQSLDPGLFTFHMYRAQIGVMRDGAARAADLDSVASHVIRTLRSISGTSLSHSIWRFPGPHQRALLASAPDGDAIARLAYHLAAGLALASQGDSSSSRAAYDSAARLATADLRGQPDDDLLHSSVALAYAALGRCSEALAHGERSVALMPIAHDALVGPLRLEVLAEVEAHCGRSESAIDRIELLLRVPSNITAARLRADPAFAGLRGMPRFAQLVAR
jgi:TolB-like protein